MIRFEQDPRAAIEEIIREEVCEDMYGHLCDVDRAVDAIMCYVDQLRYEIELLKAKLEASEDYEDDGQPSEMQEWQDYDRDC